MYDWGELEILSASHSFSNHHKNVDVISDYMINKVTRIDHTNAYDDDFHSMIHVYFITVCFPLNFEPVLFHFLLLWYYTVELSGGIQEIRVLLCFTVVCFKSIQLHVARL